MAFFRDHSVPIRILDPGYGGSTKTPDVVFPGRRTVCHSPVPYPVCLSIFHSWFPELVYRETVEKAIPVVTVPGES